MITLLKIWLNLEDLFESQWMILQSTFLSLFCVHFERFERFMLSGLDVCLIWVTVKTQVFNFHGWFFAAIVQMVQSIELFCMWGWNTMILEGGYE